MDIVRGVSRLVRNAALEHLAPIVSLLAIFGCASGDPKRSPTSVDPDRYLGIYLPIGDTYMDFRRREGEFRSFGGDMVYRSTDIPPLLTPGEAMVLSAHDGLFVCSSIER